jgi:hypothetical protein
MQLYQMVEAMLRCAVLAARNRSGSFWRATIQITLHG